MPIVQTVGNLQALTDPPAMRSVAAAPGWFTPYATYALMYAKQPNVRTCVDFLSRNIAQLGLHVYRRVSDTDRERLIDHDLARWLERPNPWTCRYRHIESLIGDIGIYFNAYWLKLRSTEAGRKVVTLVRLPPEEVTVDGWLLPSEYAWQPSREREPIPIPPDDLCVFSGYNPGNPLTGLSPLETLRSLLLEEAAATEHRSAYWQNASRMEGIIERPLAAARWTKEQKIDWRTQWQERFAGPLNAGMVAVLEDGMTWKQTSFSAKDSEYVTARKLTREEVAAAYHIPLPMVGILDHATFSNIKEQHKQLYADTLGPYNEWVQQEIERQLLPECDDIDRVYTEFNIAEKLKGSFEEMGASITSLVGRPVMTANEGRAKLNLPSIDDPAADELAAQAGAPKPEPSQATEPAKVTSMTPRAVERAVRSHWSRQATQLAKMPAAARAEGLDHRRAVRELANDLTPWLGSSAAGFASRVTTETYALLLNGADPFTVNREVPPCAT